MKILRIAVPVPLRRYFDYLPTEASQLTQLQPGMRVKVPFQGRELVGIFIKTDTTEVAVKKLKKIIEVIDSVPIVSPDILQLCHWIADYYHHPIGEVFSHALPVLLRKGKPAIITKKSTEKEKNIPQAPLNLNVAQQQAVEKVIASANQFNVFLLDGVTGSGKTEVYLQIINSVLAADKQVLVLVPEIGLTPQTIQRFRDRFAMPIIALHSRLTEKQRLNAWLEAQNAEAKIIIGTRSAVFTPFKNLGLIVVDEEHDLSFKQQDSLRYHARDIAVMYAHFKKIPIILGSATPSLETLQNVHQKRYQYLALPERAGNAVLPQFQILDVRNLILESGLSDPLLKTMGQHLEAGDQVMLFLNRRGFAPVLMCHDCGWMAKCKRCDVRMTYHQTPPKLHCHHCDTQKKIIKTCENCGKGELRMMGVGTERLEEVLKKYFANFSIVRIDRDSTKRKGAMEKLLAEIHEGKHQILIGTQMLAKGHHFPNVTLVAIIDADSGLFSSDFRGVERMGQLLLQVAGRSGRLEKPGKVIIQTHYPDHPLLFQLIHERYQKFSQTLLAEREQVQLPPFTFLALFRAEAHEVNYVNYFLQQVKDIVTQILPRDFKILGPIPAIMPKRAGKHRWQLLLQSKYRPILQNLLKTLLAQIEAIPNKHRVHWSLDVDPVEMD